MLASFFAQRTRVKRLQKQTVDELVTTAQLCHNGHQWLAHLSAQPLSWLLAALLGAATARKPGKAKLTNRYARRKTIVLLRRKLRAYFM